MEKVKIVLLGDEGVGKTSLIMAGALQTSRPDPPSTLQPTTFRVQLQGCACSCVCYDVPSREIEHVKSTIKACDVVLVCYAMDSNSSISNVLDTWLPLATNTKGDVPIVLVGCKSDSPNLGHIELSRLQSVASQTVNIVKMERCSANDASSAARVFALACDASLHPVFPVFHHLSGRLRSRAVRAFSRIFDIIDEDHNCALSRLELLKFHLFSYGRPLEERELAETMQYLMRAANECVTTEGITPHGFQQLQLRLVQAGRLDVTWRMLKMFGYNHQLELDPGLFESVPESNSDSGKLVMLTPEAVHFLTGVFQRNLNSGTLFMPIDMLTEGTRMDYLFHAATALEGRDPPLNRNHVRNLIVSSNNRQELSITSFLCIWAYCALVEPRRTVMAMVYLGYSEEYGRQPRRIVGSTAASRLLVCHPRRKANFQPIPRPVDIGVRVFNCLMFGSQQCGKTTLLRRVAQGTHHNPNRQASEVNKAAIFIPRSKDNTVPDTMLILVEVPQAKAEELALAAGTGSGDKLLGNDAMLFGFDCTSEQSYMQACNLLTVLSDATRNVLPVAFVSLKADLGASKQLMEMVKQDCKRLGVRDMPGLTSGVTPRSLESSAMAFAAQVVRIACSPPENLAVTPAVAARRQRADTFRRYMQWTAMGMAGMAGVVGLYQVFANLEGRMLSMHSNSKEEVTPRETVEAKVERPPEVLDGVGSLWSNLDFGQLQVTLPPFLGGKS